MEALVLSCGTGGGHNAAGQAVADELKRRGHSVVFMDPFQLAGKNTAAFIGNAYIKLVQFSPRLFGFIYSLGELYRRLPIHSPVYWANGRMAVYMEQYLKNNHFDIVIMTHTFPALMFANLKKRNVSLPKTMLVATDYTCTPFMEESDCDYYVIPSKELTSDFCSRGVKEASILPYGIPVRREFIMSGTRSEACARIHLDERKKYILLTGGSMGAGNITDVIKRVLNFLQEDESRILIVICGNNDRLYHKLQKLYAENNQICIMGSTTHMADYLRVCDVFITKPGGLSSTEAAASGVSLIHISPIPGCETCNLNFFAARKMSIAVRSPKKELLPALYQLEKESVAAEMKQAQSCFVGEQSTAKICDFIEGNILSKKEMCESK